MAKRGRRSRPPIIRFLEKILVSDTRSFEGSPCWIWQGTYDYKVNYPASFRVTNDKQERPYRFSYMYFIGEVPPRMEVHHRCYHPPCCNPLHLGLLTHRDNVLDGEAPTARHARKTHCPKGHPYSGDNLVQAKQGRACKTCASEYRLKRKIAQPDYYAKYKKKPQPVPTGITIADIRDAMREQGHTLQDLRRASGYVYSHITALFCPAERQAVDICRLPERVRQVLEQWGILNNFKAVA